MAVTPASTSPFTPALVSSNACSSRRRRSKPSEAAWASGSAADIDGVVVGLALRATGEREVDTNIFFPRIRDIFQSQSDGKLRSPQRQTTTM